MGEKGLIVVIDVAASFDVCCFFFPRSSLVGGDDDADLMDERWIFRFSDEGRVAEVLADGDAAADVDVAGRCR